MRRPKDNRHIVAEVCMWGASAILAIVIFKDVILKEIIQWWII